MMRKWDLAGDRKISKLEFSKNVRELGLEGSDAEVDSLFESLDEDNSGSLEMVELRQAIPRLQSAARQAAIAAIACGASAFCASAPGTNDPRTRMVRLLADDPLVAPVRVHAIVCFFW